MDGDASEPADAQLVRDQSAATECPLEISDSDEDAGGSVGKHRGRLEKALQSHCLEHQLRQ